MILLLYLFRGSRWAAVDPICFGPLSGGAGAFLIALIDYAIGRVNSATTVLVCRQTTAQILRRQTIVDLSVFAGAGKWENALQPDESTPRSNIQLLVLRQSEEKQA